jgi:hypothetical protein
VGRRGDADDEDIASLELRQVIGYGEAAGFQPRFAKFTGPVLALAQGGNASAVYVEADGAG